MGESPDTANEYEKQSLPTRPAALGGVPDAVWLIGVKPRSEDLPRGFSACPRKAHDVRPFFLSLWQRRRRIDQALFAVAMAADLPSISSRKVDDLLRARGADADTLSRRLPALRLLGPGAMNTLARSARHPDRAAPSQSHVIYVSYSPA